MLKKKLRLFTNISYNHVVKFGFINNFLGSESYLNIDIFQLIVTCIFKTKYSLYILISSFIKVLTCDIMLSELNVVS